MMSGEAAPVLIGARYHPRLGFTRMSLTAMAIMADFADSKAMTDRYIRVNLAYTRCTCQSCAIMAVFADSKDMTDKHIRVYPVIRSAS